MKRIIVGLLGCLLVRLFPDKPRRQGKAPIDFTLAEVCALPPGHVALLGIALTHLDENTACEAAERITSMDQLCILANMQEALVAPRLIAIRRLNEAREPLREALFVSLATRDDNSVVAMFAAHHVTRPDLVRRLQRSKSSAVRIIGLMKEHDPKHLERLLRDEHPEVRAKARERLALRFAN